MILGKITAHCRPNMTNFGASLKKARESKGISLDQIALDTRIATRFLTAIETEQFHLLPGGIFNRGFVRTYAQKVGLDPDRAVAEYQQLTEVREHGDEPGTVTARRPATVDRRLYSVAIGLLALLIGIFYFATRESNQAAQTANLAAPPPETTAADFSAVPEPEPARPTPSAQAITVAIEARERTWIKVKADGNSVLRREVLQPGMTRTFSAQASIDISVGSAGGLDLKINGQTARPLGKSGQARSVRITPNNLNDFIG